jgi:hypothetical protein
VGDGANAGGRKVGRRGKCATRQAAAWSVLQRLVARPAGLSAAMADGMEGETSNKSGQSGGGTMGRPRRGGWTGARRRCDADGRRGAVTLARRGCCTQNYVANAHCRPKYRGPAIFISALSGCLDAHVCVHASRQRSGEA